MSNKNGPVSWTDENNGSQPRKNSKDTFLKLNPGSNVVRLLTMACQYHQHKYMIDGGKKYGYRINCSKVNGSNSCPVCDKGDKPKRRWFLGVIDRKTNTYKVLDIGYSIFKSIMTLSGTDDWGDPIKYDIDIVCDPNGGAANYYAVVPKPPRALSANDLVIKEENSQEEIERRTQAPTAEKVQERLDTIMAEIRSNGGGNHSSGASVSQSANNNASEEDDDGDTFFKDHDKKQSPF